MKKVVLYACLIGMLWGACKPEEDSSYREVYVRRYDINDIDILTQFSDSIKYRIDTLEYIPSKPLGKYNYSDKKVFSDKILDLWNQVSLKEIQKRDPELKNDENFVKYQLLRIGDNYRTEFWRTINHFYPDIYDFNNGFYVVETFNQTGTHYHTYYLVKPDDKSYVSYKFKFGEWVDNTLIAYLNNIAKIDSCIFIDHYSELKKDDLLEDLFGTTESMTISYFSIDTIESYSKTESWNNQYVQNMKDLLDGLEK